MEIVILWWHSSWINFENSCFRLISHFLVGEKQDRNQPIDQPLKVSPASMLMECYVLVIWENSYTNIFWYVLLSCPPDFYVFFNSYHSAVWLKFVDFENSLVCTAEWLWSAVKNSGVRSSSASFATRESRCITVWLAFSYPHRQLVIAFLVFRSRYKICWGFWFWFGFGLVWFLVLFLFWVCLGFFCLPVRCIKTFLSPLF